LSDEFGPSRCHECGASQPSGAECRSCFDLLLAFENERPEVFAAVHHLTVATFFLQHPSDYTSEALASWHTLLVDALDGRASARELQRRHSVQYAGARRVRMPGIGIPKQWPRSWPITVSGVINPLEPLPLNDVYVERARAWAAATRATLDAGPLRGTRGDER
jgi:Family of unknown function (DUF5946)